MSKTEREFDRSVRGKLTQFASEIEEIKLALQPARVLRSTENVPIEQYTRHLSRVLVECQQIIRDHASGLIPASDETLSLTAQILDSARATLDSLANYLHSIRLPASQ